MTQPALIRRRGVFPPALWIALAAGAVLSLAVALNLDSIRGIARRCRIESARAAAQGLWNEGRADLALLRLKEILRKYPHHPGLLADAAAMLEGLEDPNAVALRRRAVAAAPDDPAALLALASTLVHFGGAREAAGILDRLVSRPPEETAPFAARMRCLRGLCLMASGEYRAARAEFLEARRLDPGADDAQFNAVIAGLCVGPPESDGALVTLRSFASRPQFAERAAAAWAEAALRNPAVARTAEERLRLLRDLEKETAPESPHFRIYLEALAAWEPGRIPAVLHNLLSAYSLRPWLVTRHLRHLRESGQAPVVRQALLDARTNPALNHPPLALLEAELAADSGDDAALAASLRRPAWSAMPATALVFKLWLARDSKTVRQEALETFLSRARSDPDGLAYSALLLERWRFPEALDAWAALAVSEPAHRPLAVPIVVARCLASGQTRRLRDFYDSLASRPPLNPDFEVKAVYLTLLLEQPSAAWLERAERLGSAPDASCDAVSVYAFALHRSGNTELAVQLLGRFAETDFQSPQSALIAALVNCRRDPGMAVRLLDRHQRGFRLPEERNLGIFVQNYILSRPQLEGLPDGPSAAQPPKRQK